MCGIAGIFHYRQPDHPVHPDLLDAMTDALAHRGPDGRGTFRERGIGLGHRRLAILDLTDNGRQPMADEARRYVITYNGEIYNYRDIRRDLETRGTTFRSNTDTEVILHAYRVWGEDIVNRLSGIFAFAIWDGPKRALFLARDPMGVKPLFYSDFAGTFRFGSEVKAILADPDVDRALDDEAIDAFLTFSYTPAPLTGYANVRQLPPGHSLCVTQQGVRIRRYWSCPYTGEAFAGNFDDAVAEFTDRFNDLTRKQLISDVPVGAFLSGGLDSAAIVRAMVQADSGPVQALTVGFSEKGFDEREPARQTASTFGVDLFEQEARIDAAELLPAIARHAEEPLADSSMLPVYLLCKAARERFTVAMSGDGADELLAGYDTYRATATANRYRRLPASLRRRLVQPLVACIPPNDRKYNLHMVANRFIRGAEFGPGRDHAAWRIMLHPELKARLLHPDVLERIAGFDPLARYVEPMNEVPPECGRLARLLHADTGFYLPSDMLAKVDRMSMAHGLEVRVPFLDREFVAFLATLPGEYKLHRGRIRKHILRESLRPSLPTGLLDRPKSGFNIPLDQWMRGSLRELFWDAVNTQRQGLREWFDIRKLNEVMTEHDQQRTDHGHALFTILMLALWRDNEPARATTPRARFQDIPPHDMAATSTAPRT